MRAGLKGGRGAGGCQPNSAWAAAPHTRPWQAPMPQRLASLAWLQPGCSARADSSLLKFAYGLSDFAV